MIVRRAFVREVLQTCAAVLAILIAIFLVTRVVDYLRQAAEGDIAANSVLLLLMLKMITYFDILIPLVVYISILLVMGRWNRDNEMIVLSACGIGMKEFLVPAGQLLFIVGLMVGACAILLAPLSSQVGHNVQQEFRARTDVSAITPGVFAETRNGSGVYFIESKDAKTKTYQNVFVYNGSAKEDSVVVAEHAYKTVDEKTNDDFLVLEDGYEYRGIPGNPDYSVVDFETFALRLKQNPIGERTLPVKAQSMGQLLESNHPTALGEFHWRLSKVAMLPVLILLALSFSSLSYRKNRFPGLMMALLVYFIYSNALGFTVALIRRGAAHPHLSLWLVHLGFLIVAILLFRRRMENKRLIPGLSA